MLAPALPSNKYVFAGKATPSELGQFWLLWLTLEVEQNE